jgi:Flp pilus assembly protein TadG
MIVTLLRDDMRGGALIEFTVALPFFMLLMFGLIQAGLILWTQAGLQHGVEVATRCASVNYSANRLGAPVNAVPSCFGIAPNTPVTTRNIQDYALANSFGLVTDYSTFTVTLTAPVSATNCNLDSSGNPAYPGYVITASQDYHLLSYIFSVTLKAGSYFPITCS